ncbi:DUF167 domain-containing protein [Derxia gummosa]|uniref:UPF0235 protein n=1 Tax=Derxia gummosa DSM 723 TaxID=1121388 RepID=A0A8B6X234_9BURK|nr:DUF167 domain-containing protein [Derxia gummosa]
MPACDWLRRDAAGRLLIELHVQPGARCTEAVGLHDGALKLKLAAPPVDGKANELLVKWIAERCGVGRREVELVSGQTSRRKRVSVSGIGGGEAALDAVMRSLRGQG